MRKQELRRGTAAYRLAKAQGRLPSQIAAKKKASKAAPVKKATGRGGSRMTPGKMAAAEKRKAVKKATGRGGSRMTPGKMAAAEKRKADKEKAKKERNRQKGRRNA